MQAYFAAIEKKLPEVLDKGVFYTPASAAEEFRQEYPQEFADFMEAYSQEFTFSGCGQRRGHINGFAIILANLEKKGLLKRVTKGNGTFWERV